MTRKEIILYNALGFYRASWSNTSAIERIFDANSRYIASKHKFVGGHLAYIVDKFIHMINGI